MAAAVKGNPKPGKKKPAKKVTTKSLYMLTENEISLESIDEKLTSIKSIVSAPNSTTENFARLEGYLKEHIDKRIKEAKEEILQAIKEGK